MRAVVQRVSAASVTVDGVVVGQIGAGFLVLLGVTHDDGAAEAMLLARKIAGLRVFEDNGGKMNLALADIGGAVLAVSQFTLYGDVRKGRRPSFTDAARPEPRDPHAVAQREALELLPRRRVINARVGQHTVAIAEHQAQSRRPRLQLVARQLRHHTVHPPSTIRLAPVM